MDEVVKTIAREVAPQLDAALNKFLSRKCANTREGLINVLWDNKVGILRILQAAAK